MSAVSQSTPIRTLADLRRFLDQCERLGIPEDAAPSAITSATAGTSAALQPLLTIQAGTHS